MIKTLYISRTVCRFTFDQDSSLGAQVHIDMEDFEKAVADCGAAIALNPNLTKVRNTYH